MKIEKNGLTLTHHADGRYTCDDLATVPQRFVEIHGEESIKEAIEKWISSFRALAHMRLQTKEERDAVPDAEALRIGQQRHDIIVDQIHKDVAHLTLFEQFLFWGGYWWYYHPDLMAQVTYRDYSEILSTLHNMSSKLIVAALPDQIKKSVEGMKLRKMDNRNGHYALLFTEDTGGPETRRIITDTQLFELREVGGYSYLDISAEGQPIARCCCRRGGERAFFDGTRLMSHEAFRTCAPKTILIKDGYKVNSTGCSIVNGQLYPLIDADDKVAHTTGAFFGMVEFTRKDQIEAIAMAESSAARMQIKGNEVFLDDQELKPIGIFDPAPTSLLDSGFTLVGWSEFREVVSLRYNKVAVVDDRQDWIQLVTTSFGEELGENLVACHTDSAEQALAFILQEKPEAVILDMHFTPEQRFEGLWIANQLHEKGFAGAILLASSYGMESLKAMQKLITRPTIATGKDIGRVRLALCGKLKD